MNHARHLAYLKQSGLVVNRRSGTSMVYSINGSLEASGLEILGVIHKEMTVHTFFQKDLERMINYKSKHLENPAYAGRVARSKISKATAPRK